MPTIGVDGGQVPASLALVSLRLDAAWEGDARAAILAARDGGYRAVQLDAAWAGVRARELGRSARRDLAALLRRLDLRLSGLDLWIPAAEFAEPASADRALGALLGGVGLAGELAALGDGEGGVLSVTLGDDPALLEAVRGEAERCGVTVADHRWPIPDGYLGAEGVSGGGRGVGGLRGEGGLRAGFDPATVMAAGGDASRAATGVAGRLGSARVSDLGAGVRVTPGSAGGRLDLGVYRVVLATGGYRGCAVVDLRGVSGAAGQIAAARRAWDGADPARAMSAVG